MYQTFFFFFLIESLNKHREIEQTHTHDRNASIKSWLLITSLSNNNIEGASYRRFHKRKMNKQIEIEYVMNNSDKNEWHHWYASLYAWWWGYLWTFLAEFFGEFRLQA